MTTIDWNSSKPAHNHPKNVSIREQIEQREAGLQEAQANAELFKQMKPLLSKTLFEMLGKGEKLNVTQAFEYFTEEIPKPDGMYKSNGIRGFEIVKKLVKSGEELEYSKFEPHLNNLWFTTKSGQEIAISTNDELGFSNLVKSTQVYPTTIKFLQEQLKQETQ